MVSLRNYKILLVLRLLGADGSLAKGGVPATHVATSVQNVEERAFEISPTYNEDLALVPSVTVSDTHKLPDAAHEAYGISGDTTLENHIQQDGKTIFESNVNSRKRKAEVESSLARHREEIQILPVEFGWAAHVMAFPREKFYLLRKYGVPASKKKLVEVVEDLERFRGYILQLVQEKLREWGRIKRKCITEIMPDEEHRDLPQRSLLNLAEESQSGPKEQEGQSPLRVSRNAVEAQTITPRDSPQQESNSQQRALSEPNESQRQVPKRIPELDDDSIHIICEKAKHAELSELNELLRSLFFPMNNNGWETRIETRVSYEKSIFQAISFMCQFELLNREKVRYFFSMENTLEFTALHLKRIFTMGKSFFKDHQAIMPDLNFMLTHWKTEHLHHSLKALEKYEQGQILFTVLKETIISFEDLYKNGSRSARSTQVHRYIMSNDVLSTLNKWNDSSRDENEAHMASIHELGKNVSIMIYFFQNPRPLVDDENIMEMKRAEYLMSFHILNFIKTYNYHYLKAHVSNPVDFKRLEKQIDLLQTALGIHQLFNQLIDYESFLMSDSNDEFPIPVQLQKKRRVELNNEIGKLMNDYPRLKQEVSDLASNDLPLANWLHGGTVSKDILEFLDDKTEIFQSKEMKVNRNVWMIKRRVFSKRIIKNLLRKL